MGDLLTVQTVGDLLTVTQAAERLGLTAQGLRVYIKNGRIKAMKPGHDWFIETQEVARFMAIARTEKGNRKSRTTK